ncbi:DgyrCDS4342 [Dimorphilus gyrociliatus]|uniref:DgyrCDS4342 n=1 Tax=Dimorphilus gyrociliatus TaxID=2664684 RepID=A0A7I8VGR1_9ANNE|nr:DgyrCDS4342 [Dimorphilus gyrociliatus]
MANEQSNIQSQLSFKGSLEGIHHLKGVKDITGEAFKRKRWRRSLNDNSDSICSSRKVEIEGRLQANGIKEKFLTEVLIAVTTNSINYLKPSTVYRRFIDHGRSFTKINKAVAKDKAELLIRPGNGLQKHALDTTKLYIIESIEYKSIIYISHDSGKTWKKTVADFDISSVFVFHPIKQQLILTLNDRRIDRPLYISKDGAFSWRLLRYYVVEFSWSDIDEDIIYATVKDDFHNPLHKLLKINVRNNKTQVVLDNVHSFGNKQKFLYASVQLPKKEVRMLMVSIDEAKTWIEAQVPHLTSDRFFSVLDMSEDLIFLHVDNPGDTGHGTLYTSGARGLVYSESLLRHLYPNTRTGDLTDFYKVLSMDGVYITSKILESTTIITLISYDRGAEWKSVPVPKNAECSMEVCSLQIYNSYSASQGVKGSRPVSVANAPGLIIVHGHVGDSLQRRDTDVYISNDGGYSFFLALKGPHIVQIGDHGGLLVAIPKDGVSKTLKFSTDEGNCWIDYKFTTKEIIVTGLLTEPGNKVMTVSIWGYTEDTHEWNIIVVDFEAVIKEQCKQTDYEEFHPHKGNKLNGCYLGLKKVLKKLKKDSICRNGYDYSVEVKDSSVCKCDKSDYECDYGYVRNGIDECKISPDFKGEDLFICERGHLEKIVSEGYRLIPGDKCKGGFRPISREIDMTKVCRKENRMIYSKHKSVSAGKIAFCVIFVLFLVCAILIFLWRRYYTKKADTGVQYSILTEESKRVSIWSDNEDELNKFENTTHNSTDTAKINDSSAIKPFHDDSDVEMLE